MPPIKKAAAPRKSVPRKAPTVPPQSVTDDNFHDWEDRQHVVSVTDDGSDDFPSGEESESIQRERATERPPNIPSPVKARARSLADRWRDSRQKQRGPGRPKKAFPRVSVENIVAMGWGVLAQMAQPVSLPVARTLALQAPVAGTILDGPIKDTVLDRMLQPLARAGEGGEAIFALIAPPILVGVLTSERTPPAMQATLAPALKMALKSWMKIAGPQLDKLKKEEEEFEREYGQSIDAMIEFILTGGNASATDLPPNGYHPTGVPTATPTA